MNRARSWLVTGVVVSFLPGAAWALINPNFTPIHLADQSGTILKLKGKGKAPGDRAEFTVLAAIKGKAPARVTLDLTRAPGPHARAAREYLSAASGAPVLLFAGTYEEGKGGFLHVGGKWLKLAGAGAAWELVLVDGAMQGTWAGGTDMLERCVRYVLAGRGAATVPVKSDTAWRTVKQVGAVAGKVTSVAAVDLAGDGKVCLYVASAGGDKLLRPVAGKEQFRDVTAKVKLAARSVASAWGDFTGDGRADLASVAGGRITLWSQNADGTFRPAKAGGKYVLPGKCPPLATVGAAGKPVVALLVSGTVPPLVLTPAGRNSFQADRPPVSKMPDKKWGAPQGCLVADFNNDSLPDIIQPFEADGLLFLAKAGGGFAPGKPCGVHCTAGGGVASAGDFDGDGHLDVLAAGAEGIGVFHNLRNGTFAETLGVAGEIAYKGQPFASGCGVCDFNNDARQDVFITYSAGMALLYFNRGFRSFGEAPDLEMGLEDIWGDEPAQEAGLFADFNDDAAEDFVLIRPNGQIWCAYNDLGGDGLGIKVRIDPKSTSAGPVTVTAWRQKRCLGAFLIRPAAAPTLIGAEDVGTYLLKYRFPGGKPQQQKVTIGDKPVSLVLKSLPAPPRPAK